MSCAVSVEICLKFCRRRKYLEKMVTYEVAPLYARSSRGVST